MLGEVLLATKRTKLLCQSTGFPKVGSHHQGTKPQSKDGVNKSERHFKPLRDRNSLYGY